MAAGGRFCVDGGGFQFQPLYQEEADGLLIGRHTLWRVDLSSSLRRKQRTSIHDLLDNGHGHIGLYTAFHDYDAHGSVRTDDRNAEANLP